MINKRVAGESLKEASMSLKGSQTEKNILTAFCGESQARNRYTYFSAQAKKEGLVQISEIFDLTISNILEFVKR